MTPLFTIGIEEELQMVNRDTGQLVPYILTIMEKGKSIFGENIKPEMMQSTVEAVTDICPDITAARCQLKQLRTDLARLLAADNLALISAGTHPCAHWIGQQTTPNERYAELEEELQDIARSILIFGLHVHIGVGNNELANTLINQLRSWLPHLLALSSNSPFWAGRHTGIKSYRQVVWKSFPRSGVPEPFNTWNDFDRYVQGLVAAGYIDNAKKIWWDIRLHPFFHTIEFRVCDMPATLEDSLAIAALCQALVAKLTWLYQHGMGTPVLPRYFIEENKWRAMRYALDAEISDFVQGRRMSMRTAISELLDFVDDVVDDLGSRCEIEYIRALLADPRGVGSDRQLAIYRETESFDEVMRFLMRQTMHGIAINAPVTEPSIR